MYSLEAHIAVPVTLTAAGDDVFSLARQCLTAFDPDPNTRKGRRQRFVDAFLKIEPDCQQNQLQDALAHGLREALDDYVANEDSGWVVRALIDKRNRTPHYIIEISTEIEICTASDAISARAMSSTWEEIETLLKTPNGLADLTEPLKQDIRNRLNQQAPGAAKFFGL